MTKSLIRGWAVVLGITVAAMSLGACTTTRRGPISTSLTGLTSESRTFDGSVLKQSEFISIAGLLPTPAPGLIYYLGDASEQQSLLGISFDMKSFLLVGESLPDRGDISEIVSKLKQEIEAVDRSQSQVIEKTSTLHGLNLQRAALATPGEVRTTPATSTPESVRAADVAAMAREAILTSLTSDIATESAAIAELHKDIGGHITKIRELSATPGILIARWNRESERNAQIGAPPFIDATAGDAGDIGGYVVLGGIRIVIPFFSNDYLTMGFDVEEATPGSLENLKFAGVTTYMLQAREIAYTSSSASLTYAKLKASASLRQLGDFAVLLAELQRVSLEMAYRQSEQLVSGGRTGNFQWKRVELNFSDRWKMPRPKWKAKDALQIRADAQRDLLAVSGATTEPNTGSAGEWMTVVSQMISQGSATRVISSIAKSMGVFKTGQAEALEARLLDGSVPALMKCNESCTWPNCPKCGKKPNGDMSAPSQRSSDLPANK